MNIEIASRIGLVLALTTTVACGDDGSETDGNNDTGTAGSSDSGNDDDTPTSADDDTPTSADDDTPADTGTDTGDDTGPGTGDDSDTGTPAEAQVRVMHLGVNAPAVDVFANGEGPVFSELEFRNSTEYAAVPAGDYTFEVSVSGTPASEAVLAPELPLDAATNYTAVAIGDLEMTDGDPPLQAIALVDDDDGIDAENVRITVIHAAPAVGQVDLWEVSDAENPLELLTDVDFAAFATLDDIPAGELTLGLDVDNDASPDVVFSVDATDLGGTQVNVYANSDAEGGVALVLQLPDGTTAVVDPD